MCIVFRYGSIGIVTTGAVAGGFYWFGTHLFLAASAGLVWAAAVAMLAYLASEHPGYETGDIWRDARWSAASVLVVIVALNGSLVLALSLETRAGIAFVIGGVGLVGYVSGTLSVLKSDGDSAAGDSPERIPQPGTDRRRADARSEATLPRAAFR